MNYHRLSPTILPFERTLTNWKLNLVYITLMTSLGNPLGNQSNNFLNQILSINIKLIHLPLQTNGYKIVDSNLLT